MLELKCKFRSNNYNVLNYKFEVIESFMLLFWVLIDIK